MSQSSQQVAQPLLRQLALLTCYPQLLQRANTLCVSLCDTQNLPNAGNQLNGEAELPDLL